LEKGTLAHRLYAVDEITERHRHRLEVNNLYLSQLEEKGLTISGFNRDFNLVEVVEIKNHPFFIACQYHPEFKSKPFSPHPIFKGFIEASDRYFNGKNLSL